MKLGYIGLGKMGKNMVFRLLEKKYQIVAWNRSPESRAEVEKAGAITTDDIKTLVTSLPTPRIIWLMLPSGDVTHQLIEQLSGLLSPGDTIIDGSNNFYKNTLIHAELLQKKQIGLFDAGVSGGPGGARTGACLMVGGKTAPSADLVQLFTDVAAPNSYHFFPGAGAGHFVKMVHNGIEYGMMQAIGEGFEVMKKAPYELDLLAVAKLYNHGSVIQSSLVNWLASAYEKQGSELSATSGSVKHSGEGQWTVETAKELGVPTPIISGALQFRIDSQSSPSYTGQVVSALRHEFGGHDVSKENT